MKINHLLAGTALATTLMFAAGPSMATPIDLTGGYTGQIVIHYNNYRVVHRRLHDKQPELRHRFDQQHHDPRRQQHLGSGAGWAISGRRV